ncbi:serine hydrolase domain-containing protein [Aestuariivirga litoralis]|nr:serine hydrolase domain-containing protein [Aestuariivirga litoralis]
MHHAPHLTRRHLLALAAATVLPAPLAMGAAADELSRLLAERWTARYGGKPGGLTLLALTPRGDFFATTLEGVTAKSHFRGASTTKTFTAAAIMLLDQRGLLKIDDVLTATMPGKSEPYLPDTPAFAIPHKADITIRQLLSHRAGVFDLANQDIPADKPVPYAGKRYVDWAVEQDAQHSFTKPELIGVVAETQVSNAAPGAGYGYSDTHYTLLGEIVERVSGLPLDQFKRTELLTPNGLDDTQFIIDGHTSKLPPPAIGAFSLEQGKAIPMDDYNYSYDPGSGNVFTTPADLVRWIRLLVRGEAGVSKPQVARMTEVLPDSHYGLGLSTKSAGTYDLGYGHNGGTPGFLTDLAYNPANDMGYVLVSSLIDFDDLRGQLGWMDEVAAEALQQIAKGQGAD